MTALIEAAPVELTISEVDDGPEAPLTVPLEPLLGLTVAEALVCIPEFNAEILAVLTEYADPVTVEETETVWSNALTVWLAVGAAVAVD